MPKLDEPEAAKKAPAKRAAAAMKPDKGQGDDEPKLTGSRLLAPATKLDDIREVINGLWSGEQGTGKTSAVAAMANNGPATMVNAEGGIKRRALEKLGINTANIRVLPNDPADLTEEFLLALFWETKAELEADPAAIYGVVWDSITETHVQMVRNVMEYQLARAEVRGVSRVKDAEPGDMINQHFTDLADYGIMTSQLRNLLRKYRDLPCHFAVTSLLRRDKDDDGKVVYRPAVTPALQKDLLAFQDVVCVTSVEEMADGGDDEYRGLFRPVGKYRGKDRFHALPKRLIDPAFNRVAAYIHEELDVDTDPIMAEARKRHAALGLVKGEKAAATAAGEEPDDAVDDEADDETAA